MKGTGESETLEPKPEPPSTQWVSFLLSGTFSNNQNLGTTEIRREGGECGKERGHTFFDTRVVLPLVALRAVTHQVSRGEDTAAHPFWTPAASAVVGLRETQQAAGLRYTGIASWRENTKTGVGLTHTWGSPRIGATEGCLTG